MLSLEVADYRGVVARIIDRIGRQSFLGDNAVLLGDAVVVLTIGGRLVDNTHTAVGRDVCVVQDLEAEVLELVVQVVEQRLVLPTKQISALEFLYNLVLGLLGILVQG